MKSETNAKNRTTAMNCHFINLAFERNPLVNPQMREHTHTHTDCECHLRIKFNFASELVLTDKASNNADTDMNASAMRQSHQAKLVQLICFPAISGTFNSLFKVLCIFPS